jgi:hypothetical protein
MDSPEHKSSKAEAQSPTSTKSSNESEAGEQVGAMTNAKSSRYGKIAAVVALLLLFGATAVLVVVFVTGENEIPSGADNLRSSLVDSTTETPRPSFDPTNPPSPAPSPSPSGSPSSAPSTSPSVSPSAFPSLQPSGKPSSQPSFRPTRAPTTSPTFHPTSSPTRELVPDGLNFRLKMYWERWFFWQEEYDERRWCLECTTCEQLTTSGQGDGCADEDTRDGRDCRNGDSLWTMRCDGWENGSGNAKFEVVRSHPEADQIKIRGKNLCLERASNVHLHLQPCDSDSVRQLWLGFRLDGQPFELRPLQQNLRASQYDGPVETERCLSQHHHPKAGEVIYLEECELARFWNTVLWEMY